MARLPETTVFYRDVDTMEWYLIMDKEYVVDENHRSK